MVELVGAAGDAATRSGNSLRDLLSQTLVLTRRLLIVWVRNPVAIVHALVMPVACLITLRIVFGDWITSITGQNALYRSVPLMVLLGGMTGAAAAGVVGINAERHDGFLARLWALPLQRAAGLLSRLAAETIRLLVTTLVILGTGIMLGFRFHRGALGALLWLAVPLIVGVAFSALVTTVAVYWSKAVLVEALQPVNILAAMFCTGFAPVDRYPDWAQPLVRYQPMSQAVDAMRGLSIGGPVLWPMIGTLVWSVGIFAACLWPIAVGYRRASTSR